MERDGRTNTVINSGCLSQICSWGSGQSIDREMRTVENVNKLPWR